MGKHGVDHKAEGEGCKLGQEPFWWFLLEGMGEAGQAGLGLADLNNFRGSGTRGLSLVVWCLALG